MGLVVSRAGRSLAWIPHYLGPGLKLWLRGDMGITLGVGSNVITWADQSGNGNDYSQPSAAVQPTYLASSPDFSGHPAVVCSRVPARRLDRLSAFDLNGGNYSFAFVYKGTDLTTDYQMLLVWEQNTPVFVEHTTDVDNTAGMRVSGSPHIEFAIGSQVGVAQSLLYRLDLSPEQILLYRSGVQVGSTIALPPGTNATALRVPSSLGGYNFPSWGTSVSIAEVIVYEGIMSLTQRSRFFGYTLARYGV
jgi:hypothetical protein